MSSRQELTDGVKIVQANARLKRFCVFSVMDTCTESEAPLPTYVKQAVMKVPYSNRCMACLSRREGANENKHLRCTCSNSLRLEQTCILWEADADYYILRKQIHIHLCVYRTLFLMLLGKLHDVIKDLLTFFCQHLEKIADK